MPPRVKVTALLTARPGRAEELTNLLLGMAPLCRAETGNLRWDIWQDQTQPGRYVLDELYRDGAAARAHRETPHFKNYVSKIGELAERIAVTLNPAEAAEENV